MLKNIRANAKNLSIPRVNVKKAVICGGGPSIEDYIDEIKDKQRRGFHLYALNNAAKFLKSKGITPNAQFIIDARPENISFVSPFDPSITYFLGSQCDPSLFESLKDHDKVYMVHIAAVEGAQEVIRSLNPGASMLTSASTVGLQTFNLMHVLGYRIVHAYGYDSSFREDRKHAYPQPLNDDQKVLDFIFNGVLYKSSGPMASQAEQFSIAYKRWTSQGMFLKIIGDGLLPAMWRYHEEIANRGSLEEQETVKYQKMWMIKDYRKDSPGERLYDRVVSGLSLDSDNPSTIIDFGSGTGRLAQKLQNDGHSVLAIDIAHNCHDDDITVPLVVCNLWDIDRDLVKSANFGVCTDVMEHIPTDKVDSVLSEIASLVDTVFFNIAFHKESFGHAIGETLHLTVRNADWWASMLTKYFDSVVFQQSEMEQSGIFICTPKRGLK